ncbi:type IV pilin [Methanosarcina sp. MSH10X1]|uniref:type IV pilin n=1 Tax=Methanosarcina sp. MSH10X1 TaxID=2507075 RepID=UPI000FFC4FA4|nr:type IV pilin [Methanosarcina sp. MSH10X1]RXA21343.1 type IV pilin [Methanosarcina sp. MSH10X1]
MELKKLFMNNKAVSPVIGVILMVAVTVILAAAIGSSVFGQGNAESAPQANLDIQAAGFVITGTSTSPAYEGYATFEHLGGDPINFAASATKVVASVNGGDSQELKATVLDTFEAGDVEKIKLAVSSGILKDESRATPKGICSGDIVNIKVIDKKTNQLICDKDLRF